MELKQVKSFLNKIVYFESGQINLDGNSVNEYILSGVMLRKSSKGQLFYQAELKDLNLNSIIIVPFPKVKVTKF